jgi:hypothetical protein
VAWNFSVETCSACVEAVPGDIKAAAVPNATPRSSGQSGFLRTWVKTNSTWMPLFVPDTSFMEWDQRTQAFEELTEYILLSNVARYKPAASGKYFYHLTLDPLLPSSDSGAASPIGKICLWI